MTYPITLGFPFGRNSLLALCLHLCVSGWTQSFPQRPNRYDQQSTRTGPWIRFYNAEHIEVDPEGSTYYRLITYEAGQPVGHVREYLPEGTIQSEFTYASEEPPVYVGEMTVFNASGNFHYCLFFEDGNVNYEKTLRSLQAKLDEYRDQLQPLEYAASLDVLAVVYGELGRHSEAVPYLKTILGHRKRHLSPDDPVIVLSYYALGNYMRQAEMYDSALYYFQYIIDRQSKKGGVDPAYYASALDLSAGVYTALEQYERAILIRHESMDLVRELYGRSSAETAVEAYNLGSLYADVNDHDEAKGYFDVALRIEGKLYGEQSEEYATTLYNIAGLYRDTGQYDRAIELFMEVLEIEAKVLGKRHVDYALSLHELAYIYKELERFDEAEPLFLLAREIFEADGETKEYYNTNNALAIMYYEKGTFDKASPLMKVNVAFYGENKDQYPSEFSSSLFYQAGLWLATEAFDLAEKAYNEVLDFTIAQYGETHRQCGVVYNSLGFLNIEKQLFPEAEDALMKALAINKPRSEEHPLEYAATLNSLAIIYEQTNRLQMAEENHKAALSIRKKVLGTSNTTYATSLNNMAGYYHTILNYPRAIQYYQRSIEVYEATGLLNDEYAYIVCNLAGLYYELTEFIEAEKWYLKAKDILSTREESLAHAYYLNNMATVYLGMGQFEKAESMLLAAVRIRKEKLGTDNLLYADAANNLGFVYDKYQQHNLAMEMFREGLKARKAVLGPDHPTYAESLNNLADSYYKADQLDSAAILLREAIRVVGLDGIVALDGYALYHNNLGAILKDQGNIKKAEQMYQTALKGFRSLYGETHRWISAPLLNLAVLNIAQNRYGRAETYLVQSQENLLRIIRDQFPTMNEAQKKAFWATMRDHFQLYHSIIMYQQDRSTSSTARAYDNLLVTKGLLLDASRKMKQAIGNSGDTVLVGLYAEWVEERQTLANAYSLNERRREQLGIDEEKLRERIDRLEKELSVRSDLFASKLGTTPTWKDVKNTLQPNEAAVELVRYQGHDSTGWNQRSYYAAYIVIGDASYPEMVVIGEAANLESRYLKGYKNNIKFELVDQVSYDHYWSPIRPYLRGIKKIYLSAEGVYNQINLNTLFNSETGTYLLEEVDIHLVTSTRELLSKPKVRLRKGQGPVAMLIGRPAYSLSADESMLPGDQNNDRKRDFGRNLERLFGSGTIPDLPGTEVEIKSIETLLSQSGWTTESYFYDRATEEVLKLSANPTLLHVATHGFFIGDDPLGSENAKSLTSASQGRSTDPMMLSGILMAGVSNHYQVSSTADGTGEDGILTAYESTALALDETDLVVLSACETGLGDISFGEGVYGLQRGFEVAGAKSILMSLWKVSDQATQELMSTFYSEWVTTGDRRMAFRTAQEAIKAKYKSPYYWGAFVMVGD